MMEILLRLMVIWETFSELKLVRWDNWLANIMVSYQYLDFNDYFFKIL